MTVIKNIIKNKFLEPLVITLERPSKEANLKIFYNYSVSHFAYHNNADLLKLSKRALFLGKKI